MHNRGKMPLLRDDCVFTQPRPLADITVKLLDRSANDPKVTSGKQDNLDASRKFLSTNADSGVDREGLFRAYHGRFRFLPNRHGALVSTRIRYCCFLVSIPIAVFRKQLAFIDSVDCLAVGWMAYLLGYLYRRQDV